jgi:hypothetical protein
LVLAVTDDFAGGVPRIDWACNRSLVRRFERRKSPRPRIASPPLLRRRSKVGAQFFLFPVALSRGWRINADASPPGVVGNFKAAIAILVYYTTVIKTVSPCMILYFGGARLPTSRFYRALARWARLAGTLAPSRGSYHQSFRCSRRSFCLARVIDCPTRIVW